jgi:hypothetical protein
MIRHEHGVSVMMSNARRKTAVHFWMRALIGWGKRAGRLVNAVPTNGLIHPACQPTGRGMHIGIDHDFWRGIELSGVPGYVEKQVYFWTQAQEGRPSSRSIPPLDMDTRDVSTS